MSSRSTRLMRSTHYNYATEAAAKVTHHSKFTTPMQISHNGLLLQDLPIEYYLPQHPLKGPDAQRGPKNIKQTPT